MRYWIVLMMLCLAAGCELPNTDAAIEEAEEKQTESTDQETTSPTNEENTNGDEDTSPAAVDAAQAEWDAIRWHTATGPDAKGAKRVMTLSAKISGDKKNVSFSFDRYPWRGMGLGHFFVWNGSTWEGGKFDWIREGGQSVKLLENVHHGYNGLRAPSSGTPVAFAWTSADGDERSNLAKTVWP